MLYKIKPLLWEAYPLSHTVFSYDEDGKQVTNVHHQIVAEARTPLAVYSVQEGPEAFDCYVARPKGFMSVGKTNTLEDGKKLCEEHWRLYLEQVLTRVL